MPTSHRELAPPHLVYFFDAGFEACTWVSVHAALRNTPGPLRVTLHPTDASASRDRDVQAMADRFPQARIAVQDVDLSPWRHLPKGRLPLAARSRLLLPRLHTGRVLYLDGDAIPRRDLTALWQADLQGACLGAALAPGVQVNLALAAGRSRRARAMKAKLDRRSARLDGIPMDRYFNNGVMVLDLDRITECGLDRRMSDIDETVDYTSRDQDFMNVIFRDETHLIDPTWNSGWGNAHTARPYVSAPVQAMFAASREDPAIVHFTGSEKPWSAPRPPFQVHLLLKPRQRRDRARYWAEFQTERAATEAVLGRALWP